MKLTLCPCILVDRCRFDMPLLVAVGVDNNGCSFPMWIALCADETTQSVAWVLQAVESIAATNVPTVLFSDDAAALEAALRTTWSTTKHMLCVWHMFRRLGLHTTATVCATCQ